MRTTIEWNDTRAQVRQGPGPMWRVWIAWAVWALAVAWLAWPSGPTTIGPWWQAVALDDHRLVVQGDAAWLIDLEARTFAPTERIANDEQATCLAETPSGLSVEPGSPVTAACRPPIWAAHQVPLSALVPPLASPPAWLLLLLVWPAVVIRQRAWHPAILGLVLLPYVGIGAALIGRLTHGVERPMRGDIVVSNEVLVREGKDHVWVLEHFEQPNARWVPLLGERTLGACLTASGASWWIRGPYRGELRVSRLDYRRMAVSAPLPLEPIKGYRCDGERLHLATASRTVTFEIDGRLHDADVAVPDLVPLGACMALSEAQPRASDGCDPAPDATWALTHEPLPIDKRPRSVDLMEPLKLWAIALAGLPLYLFIRRRGKRWSTSFSR